MARILVIDDEYYVRALIAKILERSGHEIVEATNGQEGIDFFEQGGQADLVITDIFMPEMDGIETLRYLKEKNPDLKIVVVSGGGKGLAKGYLPAAAAFGADATIEKPFDPREFEERIAAILA
jgi:CheY-like chemotaxis protein